MPKTFPALLLLLVAVSAASILVDRWIRAPRSEPAPTVADAPSVPLADPERAPSEMNPGQAATASTEPESARGPTTPALHPQDRTEAAAVAASAGSTQAHLRADPDRVYLVGSFLDSSGAGAGGAEISARGGWGSSWKLRSETDADGRFALALPDKHSTEVLITASHKGHVQNQLQLNAPSPGADFDMGDVWLTRSVAVRGRLVVENEGPPGPGWFLRIRTGHGSRFAGNSPASRFDPVQIAADGSFAMDELSPGATTFWAEYGSLARTEVVELQLTAGDTHEFELEHRGPDPRRQLDLQLFVGPLPANAIFREGGLSLAPRSLRLEGPATVDLVDARGYVDGKILADLVPGPYTVVFEDPRFESIRQHGVQPGHTRRLHARGRGALRVSVRDHNQSSLPDASVTVSIESTPPASWLKYVSLHRAQPDTDRLITGLPPVPLRVDVYKNGYAPRALYLDAVEPGEERVLDVELVSRAQLAVRVVADGVPVPDVTVVVAPDPLPEELRAWSRKPGASGTTDAEGRLAILGLLDGDYHVYAWDKRGRSAQSGPVALTAGVELDAELDLGPLAHLEVRVLGPGERALADYRLQASGGGAIVSSILRSHEDLSEAVMDFPWTHTSAAAAGDRFSLGPIGPGTYQLHLVASEGAGPYLGAVTLASRETRELELDLTGNFPGSATVTLAVDGLPAAGATVQLLRGDSKERVEARTDAQGVVRFSGLGAGRYWPAVVSATAEAGWSVPLAPAIDVVAAESTEANFALETSPGVLRLVDAAGTPLARLRCTAVPAPEWDQPRRLTFYQGYLADERGEVSLTLPHGEYVVFLGAVDHSAAEGDRPGGHRVTWPPSTTPLVLTIDLP